MAGQGCRRARLSPDAALTAVFAGVPGDDVGLPARSRPSSDLGKRGLIDKSGRGPPSDRDTLRMEHHALAKSTAVNNRGQHEDAPVTSISVSMTSVPSSTGGA